MGEGGGMGSSFSHAASRVHLNLAQHVAVMARFDTVGSTHPAAVGRVAASGTVGPFHIPCLRRRYPSLSCLGQILICILLLSSFSV